MEYQFLIKCSKCKKLLPLDQYDYRYSVWTGIKPQVLIKKKCCRECLTEMSLYMEEFNKNKKK